MAAKFHPKHMSAIRTAKVEVGRKSNAPAFKIHLGASAFVLTEAEAEDLADALDDAIAVFEGDPLLWEGGSQ